MKSFLGKIFLACVLFFSCAAYAEQSQNFGEYTIHYIAVNSTFLDPDIAQQYNILRGDRHAFINISVLKNTDDGSSIAVAANVSGSKKNLLQQNQTIDFVKVIEGDAIYYIGQFDFSNAENLKFEVLVQPENTGSSHSLEWSTKLYNN